MKKILFGLFAIMALAFTSCKDEVELVDPGTPQNPEKDCAGVYTGTWTQTVDDVATTATGSVTITPTDSAYVCKVTISCPDFELAETAIANITPAHTFFNTMTTDIAASFYGSVNTSDETATINFLRTVKEGRKTTTYYYSFE